MNLKIKILFGCLTAVTASFLQTPNQFQTSFNSTFLTGNHRIFKPIIIPNDTRLLDHSKTKIYETERRKPEEKLNESFQESPPKEEEPKNQNNVQKFSSRYSTKLEESQSENREKTLDSHSGISEQSENENIPLKEKSFSDRSDNYDYSEEKENRYADSEEEENERMEPQSESNEKYTDKSSEEEKEEEEEEEEIEKHEAEDRRSAEDYYGSDPENNISIQTPLSKIQYRGPQSFRNDFEGGKPRERLVSPIQRHHIKHNWPYSKSQLKSEFENSNEIPENLDEKVHEEVKKPKTLESAVEKDEEKFEANKKYNFVEERNKRIKQQKSLAAEEAKDDSKPLFQSLHEYQVNEKLHVHPKDQKKTNIFSDFEDHTLGPVVFKPNTNDRKSRLNKKPLRSPYLKALLDNEKLDQEKLTNVRSQKSVFESGVKSSLSFNHLEESDDLYSSILANIQSVFGLRTQPLKSGGGAGKGSEEHTEESKFFTWSLPLRKKGKERETQSANEVKGQK